MNEIEILKKALEIYSPTGREKKIAEFLLELSEGKGRIDEAGNFIIEKGNGDQVLLFCSHMDTVSGEIPVRIDGNKLYGRGAVDAKGPLIGMFLAFLRTEVRNIRLIFAGVTEEEGSSKGIKFLMKNIKPTWSIIGEPSGLNKITIGYKGRIKVELTFEGDGHIANPTTTNAIETAIENISEIRKRFSGSDYDSISIRPETIQGSTKKCEVRLDVRIPPGVTEKDVIEMFRDQNYEILDFTPAFEVDRRNPVVIAMKKSIKGVTDNRASLTRKTGTCDVNILSRVCDDCVVYGPGDSRLDHMENEHIDIDEFLTSIKVYQNIIQILDGKSSNKNLGEKIESNERR